MIISIKTHKLLLDIIDTCYHNNSIIDMPDQLFNHQFQLMFYERAIFPPMAMHLK